MTKSQVKILACSIFKKEIEFLMEKEKFDFDIKYLSSMLHMVPNKLDTILSNSFDSKREKILLVYGDCSPHMDEFVKVNKISRTSGVNCIEIVLGSKLYNKYKKEGTFFFMPEWVDRWQEIFHNELKLHGDTAKEFMQEFHQKIVYIDTGFEEIPYDKLKTIEKFFEMKVNILKISTDELKNSILSALEMDD